MKKFEDMSPEDQKACWLGDPYMPETPERAAKFERYSFQLAAAKGETPEEYSTDPEERRRYREYLSAKAAK